MSRLIDEIRREGALVVPRLIPPSAYPAWDQHMMHVVELMRNRTDMPVLLIDNVAEYYYTGTGQEHWDLKLHFPNLAPPWPLWWCEYKIPNKIHSDEYGDTDMSDVITRARAGALFCAANREDVEGEGIPENTRWILYSEFFLDSGLGKHSIEGSAASTCLAIDAAGRILDRPWLSTFAKTDGMEGHILRSQISFLHPMLLALSFLHCKNVAVVDNATPPKLAKRYREKHGLDPSPWKTLIIEPMKQILRKEGGSDTVGVAKAMHICRGHFKDYRQGKGLFGRYHCLVWHDAIVRGTKGGEAKPREVEVRL